MKKQIQYALAMLLLLLMACQKDPDVSCNSPTKDVNTSKKLIVGTWQWAYSKQYFRSSSRWVITNPQTDTIERSMTFNKNGQLMIYENGLVKTETTYQFRKMSEWSLFPGDSARYIISWKYNNVVWRICNDSLYLPYQSFDNDAAKDEVWKKN